MSTVQLLVTLTAPDEISAGEAESLLSFALAGANIEAEAIVEDGSNCHDPELLAAAHRWLTLEVGVQPIQLLKPERRPGMSPTFAAPYGDLGRQQHSPVWPSFDPEPAEVIKDMSDAEFADVVRRMRDVLFPTTTTTTKEQHMKENLVVVHCQLAFAVLEGHEDEIPDYVNMMLIPHQRREGGESGLIDYTIGEHYISATPVDEVSKDDGFAGEDASPGPRLEAAIEAFGVDKLQAMSNDDRNGELASIVDELFPHDNSPEGQYGDLIDLAHVVYEKLAA